MYFPGARMGSPTLGLLVRARAGTGQTSSVAAVPLAVLAVGEQQGEKDAPSILAMLSSSLVLPTQPQSPVQH